MDWKLPLYDILNMFMVGIIFMSGCGYLLFYGNVNIVDADTLLKIGSCSAYQSIILSVSIALIYETGLIVNRLGSIVVEPLMKISEIVSKDFDVKRFNELKSEFPILEILSREYALSRTNATIFFIFAIISIFRQNWIFSLFSIAITALFLASARKHSSRITKITTSDS